MRQDAHFLHHASVAVRIRHEIFHPQRRLAAVLHLCISETDLTRLVVEFEIIESVIAGLLEVPVFNRRHYVRYKPRQLVLNQEGRIHHRQPLSKLFVVV